MLYVDDDAVDWFLSHLLSQNGSFYTHYGIYPKLTVC